MVTDSKSNILSFIKRRFSVDNHWIDGNCYYFAIILNDRFPGGTIFYDVTYGHFVYFYNNEYYDWTGCISPKGKLIKWSEFADYDFAQRERIVRFCIL